MSKKQKIISDKIENFDWIRGVSEYDYLNIANPTPGPYKLDNGFDVIYGFDLLKELAEVYQKRFLIDISTKISISDLKMINDGIHSYTLSSVNQTKELKILKASILSAYEGILTNLYENLDCSDKQFYGSDYFEIIEGFKHLNESELISAQAIIDYRKLSTKYTIECISEFHKKLYDANSGFNFDEIEFYHREVFRGLGNYRYHKNTAKKKFVDVLSKFTSIDSPMPYIERQIFNSFTLSERVAERFMTQKYNQRRVIIKSYFEIAVSNLFSSFIVNDSFNIEQYELLCIPMINQNYLFEIVNDRISAEFFINDSLDYPIRLDRKETK